MMSNIFANLGRQSASPKGPDLQMHVLSFLACTFVCNRSLGYAVSVYRLHLAPWSSLAPAAHMTDHDREARPSAPACHPLALKFDLGSSLQLPHCYPLLVSFSAYGPRHHNAVLACTGERQASFESWLLAPASSSCPVVAASSPRRALISSRL